jgi:hypothetical protein
LGAGDFALILVAVGALVRSHPSSDGPKLK